MPERIRRWRIAWLALAGALALHVADEALTGFLPVYNSVVLGVRSRLPWAPLPTFTFPVWLTGLTLGILLMVSVTGQVSRGRNWVRVASLILGVLMMGNAVGHAAASVYWSRPAPGVYSSPILFVAALSLLVTAARAKVREA